jgi:hypothetical protein
MKHVLAVNTDGSINKDLSAVKQDTSKSKVFALGITRLG